MKVKVRLKCFRGLNKPDDIVEYDADLGNAMVARGSAEFISSAKTVVTAEVKEVVKQPINTKKLPPKSTKIEDEEL